ncbi:hypothetical protein OU5_2151 [Pseudomonas mandelii JR-1]|jgi:hypothetical protein|uniref:Uncharacterized protein n=1 Tax=Pseudomonas mandelii JR-1 TaxID=1147786 RepID=A0A024E9J0_9PSED|nr:hypothetical protein OU5_2151 [Pseudomonas mandelii JR-1]
MLRQLFFSGAVAACNMEVFFARRKNDAFIGYWPFDGCGQ